MLFVSLPAREMRLGEYYTTLFILLIPSIHIHTSPGTHVPILLYLSALFHTTILRYLLRLIFSTQKYLRNINDMPV